MIPLAVAPIVLWNLLREGRGGSERAAAFAALFLSANVVGLLVVAAFNSTPYAYDRLHDRYAFYLIPLWLIVLVAWLADGLPRPLVATASGVVPGARSPRDSPVSASSRTRPASTPFPARSGSGSRARRPDQARSRVACCSPCSSSDSSPQRCSCRPPCGYGSPLPVAVLAVFAATAVLRLGANDRRPGERGARGRARARLDRRATSSTTRGSRSSTSSPRPVRPRASPATRCSRPSSSTSPSTAPPISATRFPTASRSTAWRSSTDASSSRTEDRSSRTTSIRSRGSSSRVSVSPPAPPPDSCSGRRAARSGWQPRRRRRMSAPRTAHRIEAASPLPNPLQIAAGVEGEQELLPLAVDLEVAAPGRGTSRSPAVAPASGPSRIWPMFESSTIR